MIQKTIRATAGGHLKVQDKTTSNRTKVPKQTHLPLRRSMTHSIVRSVPSLTIRHRLFSLILRRFTHLRRRKPSSYMHGKSSRKRSMTSGEISRPRYLITSSNSVRITDSALWRTLSFNLSAQMSTHPSSRLTLSLILTAWMRLYLSQQLKMRSKLSFKIITTRWTRPRPCLKARLNR